MKFYYHKDFTGRELSYPVDNVQKDAAERLYNMSDNAACAVEYIHEGDFAGYGSLENYIKEEGADAWSEAVQEGLDAGLAFPFCIVRHRDGSYETLAENAVDYVELCDEYEDFGHWRVQPGYYDSADITPAEAEKQHLYELAKVMREELDLKPFQTRDRETGSVIDEFLTLEEAEDAIVGYEEDDEDEGCYTPNFYEIYNTETQKVVG